jgi:hypothetical protein
MMNRSFFRLWLQRRCGFWSRSDPRGKAFALLMCERRREEKKRVLAGNYLEGAFTHIRNFSFVYNFSLFWSCWILFFFSLQLFDGLGCVSLVIRFLFVFLCLAKIPPKYFA